MLVPVKDLSLPVMTSPNATKWTLPEHRSEDKAQQVMQESPVALRVQDDVGMDAKGVRSFLAREESRASRGFTWNTEIQGSVTAAGMQGQRLGHTLGLSEWQFAKQVPPLLLVHGGRR